MSKTIKPKKWYNYISHGKAGDEETAVMIGLARHPKYKWRSVSALAKEAKMTPERVEEIILKFHKLGIAIQQKDNEEHWAYWENVNGLDAGDDSSITESDHNSRTDKAIAKISPSISQINPVNAPAAYSANYLTLTDEEVLGANPANEQVLYVGSNVPHRFKVENTWGKESSSSWTYSLSHFVDSEEISKMNAEINEEIDRQVQETYAAFQDEEGQTFFPWYGNQDQLFEVDYNGENTGASSAVCAAAFMELNSKKNDRYDIDPKTHKQQLQAVEYLQKACDRELISEILLLPDAVMKTKKSSYEEAKVCLL